MAEVMGTVVEQRPSALYRVRLGYTEHPGMKDVERFIESEGMLVSKT